MDGWTKEWPTEPGYYWFYSYRYGRISCGKKCDSELMFMEVYKTANDLMYQANGQFVFKSEPEEAWFKKAMLPEPPEDFQYTKEK